MSYQQRTTITTPFAQVYQSSGDWNYSSQPDTKTQTWLSASGTNGYSFSGNGYVFGFLVSSGLSLARQYVGSNVFYTSATYAGNGNSTWSNSDDETMGYTNTTEIYLGAQYDWSNYDAMSRFNIIRMEA